MAEMLTSEIPSSLPGNNGQGSSLTFSDPALQGHPSLGRYRTLDDLGKAHIELEKKLGTRSLDIPAQDAPPDSWQAYWKQNPDYPPSDEAYTTPTQQLPQGLELDQELVKTFKKGAHARGITNKQLEYVMGFYGENLVTKPYLESQQDLERGAEETMRVLRTRYGGSGSEAVMATAREYIRREFGDEAAFLGTIITKDGQSRPLGNIPEFIHMAYQLGLSKGYNQYVQGDGAGGLLSVEQAEQQLKTVQQQLLRKEITPQEYNAQMARLQPLITAARNAQGQQGMVGNRL